MGNSQYRVTASTNRYLFPFSPLAEKGLQKKEMSTQVTARKKRCLFLFFQLGEKRPSNQGNEYPAYID